MNSILSKETDIWNHCATTVLFFRTH